MELLELNKWVLNLGIQGVRLVPNGDRLKVDGPRELLTPAIRAVIRENKEAIIGNRRRRVYIINRVNQARDTLELKHPGRFDWSTDTPQSRVTGDEFDNAIRFYIVGTVTLDKVEAAFRAYVRTLEVPTAETA